MKSTLSHVLNEENLSKDSYTFLNMLIRADSLIKKGITRSWVMEDDGICFHFQSEYLTWSF